MTISSNSAVSQFPGSAAQAAASVSGSGSAAGSAGNAVGTQDAFLKLLVTQLQNQDPLNPMDNAQITSQLAQINTVSGINTLNTSIQQLVANAGASQTLAATGMIGHTVLVGGNSVTLNQGQAVFGINLPQAADGVQVSIKDASGNVVHTINLGAEPAGVLALGWDGTKDSGGSAAAGSYTFSVTAAQGGKAVSAATLSGAVVQGVVQGANGPQLNLGASGTVALSAVQQIL